MSKLISLVGLVALTSCSHTQAMIVTGQTLVTISDEFVATAAAMDKALDDGVIGAAQYEQWAKFGTRFQMLYPAAVVLWRSAVDAKDPTVEAQMVSTISELGAELTKWKR